MYSSYQENKSLNLESKLQQSVNRFWEKDARYSIHLIKGKITGGLLMVGNPRQSSKNGITTSNWARLKNPVRFRECRKLIGLFYICSRP
jgi:hypothetical protein